jgi:hypothetical protein
LMTQIAALESRPFCQQFFDPPDNFASPYYPYGGVIDSWPVESGGSGSNNAGGGAHIGLMQVPVSQQNAWDWIQNARDGTMCPQKKPNSATCGAAKSVGKNSFQEKLLIVYNRMLAMQKGKSPALGALTSCQLEEMALAEYGPYSSGSLENQYYYAACNGTPNGNTCSGGNWQWTINDSGAPPDTNFCAICYAAYVRATYLPGGSLSSCGETSGSADPPALDCTGCTKLGAAAACY